MEIVKPINGKEMPEGTILLAYIKGCATAAETATIEEWLKDDASHEEELMQIARIYYAQRTKERISSRDPIKAFDKIERKIKTRKRRLWIGRIVTAAACIACIVSLSLLLFMQPDKQAEIVAQTITIQSNPGMRTFFNLPDNSLVHLNAGSSLSYTIPFQNGQRKISLTGEAFFKVSPDAAKPFIVSTFDGKMSVKVKGTEFNVEAYTMDEAAFITLVEGEVNILLQNEQGVTTEHPLSPSQKATYDVKAEKLHVQRVNTELETGWITGRVIFKDTPLPEVLRKLSHFYNVEFEVKDDIIKTYLFTGTFNNRQLDQVLEYIRVSSGIEYTFIQTNKDDSEGIVRQRIILQKKKNNMPME